MRHRPRPQRKSPPHRHNVLSDCAHHLGYFLRRPRRVLKPRLAYSKATSFEFQPAGSSNAFGGCNKKKSRLVVDGAETGREYADISYPRYSRDGKRLAFLGKHEKKWLVNVDGKEVGPEVDDVPSASLTRLNTLAALPLAPASVLAQAGLPRFHLGCGGVLLFGTRSNSILCFCLCAAPVTSP